MGYIAMDMDMQYSDWHGFRRADFRFEDRDALIVFPHREGWGSGRLMMKMEYFDAFPKLETELLDAGFHLAYFRNKNRWGTDPDHDARRRFADFLVEQLHVNPRFVPIGMSCGGLISVNFASRYPDYVSLLYLDAPVMNLLSCPMGFGIGDALGEGDSGFREIEAAYGFTRSSLLTYREHPIDRIPTLIGHGLPVALVYGDSDTTVPYIENGKVLEDAYRKTGLPLYCVGKRGCGHHPHGLDDNTELIRFIRENML